MDATVIVPARDAGPLLGATLDALERQLTDASFEVIVVDNGSHDETAALAEDRGVRVIRRPRGDGPGAARDAGAAAARAPVLAFTDADCVPVPGWLEAGLGALAKGADLVQGATRPDPQAHRGPLDRTLDIGRFTGLFESANLFVRAELHERAGGFGAGLEGADRAPFGEDALFGWRAVRAGARAAFAPDALVHHAVFPRGIRAAVAERGREGLFPALVRRAPELRDGGFLYRRVFLTRRRALFALAVAGALTRRPLPAAALAAPYARLILTEAHTQGRRAAVAGVAGDALGGAALVRGSLRERTLVL